ncbi:hypothetical protein EDD17DRAFT_1548874 [Pisolithus thermaeus]|nr:hypothetical protein EDD17DRAFT_1548874 [Pisolithus thermaeus]
MKCRINLPSLRALVLCCIITWLYCQGNVVQVVNAYLFRMCSSISLTVEGNFPTSPDQIRFSGRDDRTVPPVTTLQQNVARQ